MGCIVLVNSDTPAELLQAFREDFFGLPYEQQPNTSEFDPDEGDLGGSDEEDALIDVAATIGTSSSKS